jgi:hypothetical protein
MRMGARELNPPPPARMSARELDLPPLRRGGNGVGRGSGERVKRVRMTNGSRSWLVGIKERYKG